MNLLEGFGIRFLWVLHALRLKQTPGLCPPQCHEGHIYKWPCRSRIKVVSRRKKRDRYSHYDEPINKIVRVEICGVKRAGGWGKVSAVCTFNHNHEGLHSWVVD